jgi:hypothetical protein
MLNFRYGPDGSVHAIDWYDKNQCHSLNPDVHQKTLGRIFRISHEKDRWVKVDLQKMSSEALVDLQLNRNDFYVRHARRILQERGPDAAVHARLKRILSENADVTRRLRALWTLHATEGLTERDLVGLLDQQSEYLRSWAVYLLVQHETASDDALRRFATLAQQDPSPLVRLALASALQRVPAEKRWDVLAGLVAHGEDVCDQNLPLMIWYAAEPLAELDMPRALALAVDAKFPRMFGFTVQRIASIKTPEAIRVLADQLARTTDRAQQYELVNGLGQMVKKP